MLIETFKDHLRNLLSLNTLPLLREKNLLPDLKRSKERKIDLYPLKNLDNIQYRDEDYSGILRFVVTSSYKFVLGQEGRPSKYIPQHTEMTKSDACLAAGKVHLSNETPRRILAINLDCREYFQNSASLLWPLIILDFHPELIHPDFKIQINENLSSSYFVATTEFAMNAETLHSFLHDILSPSQVWNTVLQNQFITADADAEKDSIIVENNLPPVNNQEFIMINPEAESDSNGLEFLNLHISTPIAFDTQSFVNNLPSINSMFSNNYRALQRRISLNSASEQSEEISVLQKRAYHHVSDTSSSTFSSNKPNSTNNNTGSTTLEDSSDSDDDDNNNIKRYKR